jgi:hypothetical protein
MMTVAAPQPMIPDGHRVVEHAENAWNKPQERQGGDGVTLKAASRGLLLVQTHPPRLRKQEIQLAGGRILADLIVPARLPTRAEPVDQAPGILPVEGSS